MKTLIFLSFVQVVTLQASSPFDASHLQTGQFVYRDMKDGRQVPTFTLTVNKQGTAKRVRPWGLGYRSFWVPKPQV